jgi:DNA-binding winged helix-turn-helix (wHTH) protein/tetratricopeptide (TPR) repeat protein
MTGLCYASYDVVLEPGRWLLSVGGAAVTAEPKVFELLSYLMRHQGRVVSKAELLDSLWSGDVVGESVLTRCVSCVRKLLADDSKTPRFIRTLHGRGYEFIAPVNLLPQTAAGAEAATEPVAQEAAASAEGQAAERPFIGRKSEALRLEQALLQLEARRGDFMLIRGEPGIGKTRLLEEMRSGAPHSIEVHAARGSVVEGAPAFFAWQQIFRSLVRARSIKIVRRAFESAPSGARKLLLGTDSWQVDDQLGWDSPSERFRTFAAMARGLSELAEQRPVALVFDDLHAADLVSLLLLEFLTQAPAAPILMIGAMRDAERFGDPAREDVLARLRAACRNEIVLPGLSAEEVREFVRLRFEQEHERLAASLFSRTGGNPFFLSVLTPPGELPNVAEASLPTVVQQAVAERLAALGPECLKLLRIAAVCGRTFDMLVLARAAGQDLEQCVKLLAAAGTARVIANTGLNEYRFIHDLVREVLCAELDANEGPRLHLAVALALQTLPTYRDARHAARLAHHFVEAAHCGGASGAVDLSIRAGAYALRNFGYEEAVEHFARARQLLPLSTDSDPATECAVLLDLGLAQVSAGQREAGQATLRAAAERARESGDVQELASVALNLAPGLFAIETGVFDPVLVGLLRESIEQTGHAYPKQRALLMARLALALYWSDTYDERAALCREAQTLAEQLASDDVKAAVATAYIFALLRPSNLEERRTLSDLTIELCRRAGDHHGLLMNRLLRVAMFLESGDVAAAWFEADTFQKLAEETNQPQSLWIVKAHRACQLLLDGRLSEVEQLAGACLFAGQRVHDHNALLTFGVHLTLVRIEQARAAEVLPVIRDYRARYPRIVGWRVLYAYTLYRAGQTSDSAAEYESLSRASFALPDDLNWMVSMSWLAETCHARIDVDGAAILYERFAPYAERLVVVGYAGIACLGSVERYLALLSATLGHAEPTRRHFERALAVNRRLSAILPLVNALCDYAEWLSAIGEHAAAQGYLREAAPLIEERDLIALRSRAITSS